YKREWRGQTDEYSHQPPPALAFICAASILVKKMQFNQTVVKYFIMKGITDVPELQVPIFFLVLFIYLITLDGNVALLFLVCLDHRLHNPMYFLLGNLSIVDLSCSTVTLHKDLIKFCHPGQGGFLYFLHDTNVHVWVVDGS
ncbi:unnamed protein product, partial [Ranitomeya imitator]